MPANSDDLTSVWLASQEENIPSHLYHLSQDQNEHDYKDGHDCDIGNNRNDNVEGGVLSSLASAANALPASDTALFPYSHTPTDTGVLPSEGHFRHRDEQSMHMPLRSLSAAGTTTLGSFLDRNALSRNAQKRRSSFDGVRTSDGEGDDQSHSSPILKRARMRPEERFDCPVDRGAIHKGSQSRGCCPNGLPFRGVK